MDVEPADASWDPMLYHALTCMSVQEFYNFLETARASQVKSDEALRRLDELLCTVLCTSDGNQMHVAMDLLRWWPKLCDLAWTEPLLQHYNARFALFLQDVREDLYQRRDICFYCGRLYRCCISDFVAHPALGALLCEENGSLLCDVLQLCSEGTPMLVEAGGGNNITRDSCNMLDHVISDQDDTPKPWWWIQQQEHERQQRNDGTSDCVVYAS